MKLVLFDIDGTLVSTGGAGARAFTRALHEVLNIAEGLAEVRLDGQTDYRILEAALKNAGRLDVPGEAVRRRLYRRYVECLEEELAASPEGYRVFRGVPELLAELAQSGWLVGLATGNLVEGAWVKLRAGGLDRHFRFGGFGSDARERCDLIRVAVERSRDYNGSRHPRHVFVVGDTPADIEHGHRAGAQVIAVATGGYSSSELMQFQPDLLVDSLEPMEPILEFLDARTK